MSRGSFVTKRLYPVGFMLAVTLVFISVTSIVYTVTGDRIELNEQVRLRQAVLYAAGVDLPEDPVEIDRMYDNRVREVTGDSGNVRFYEIHGEGSGEVESFVVIRTGPGLWGEITAAIGFDSGLEAFRGLEIIDQNETPGLGGRIDEAWFKEQFSGKVPPLEPVPEEGPASEGEFHAITGATFSSGAIREIMNSSATYARTEIRSFGDVRE